MRPLALLSGLLLLALSLTPAAPTRGEGKKPAKTLGTIERLDPAFDKLIGADTKLEILAGGHVWTEGPVWLSKPGYLLFSDIPRNRVYRWIPGMGEDVFLEPSGYTGKGRELKEPGSNGLLLTPKGALVLMQHGDRRVAQMTARVGTKCKFKTLADKYKGQRLNSPNDGAYKSNGDLYFTDPPYGLTPKKPKGPNDFPGRDMDFCGVYWLSADGKLTLLTKEMSRPNGIAFSPDEKTLYVANSDPEKAVWMAFPVKEDGTLGKGKVFYDAGKWVGKKKGLPDGMKVDLAGNLFATGPGGVLVFNPEGKHLGTIATGVPTANCAWGEDGSVLYVCADTRLCRIQTKTKGPLPGPRP